MVKPKTQSKKQQKRGIDFKKIKRKVGRKLPPPKNATNTEIKSKAIILPEQSIASEKSGLAVSKKGLTLKELLQQTSHHNAKVRKDALNGIKDIFLNHPAELKLHKLAVIEKLRERISDDDKLVRETLYQLLKSVVFPGSNEDNQELVVSLMMAYIFNAMTHLSLDVRLMAFKYLDLILNHYPISFSLYFEKILENYENLLCKSQFSLQDKSKLKCVLAGLVHCVSLLPCNKRDVSMHKNEDHSGANLHAFEPDNLEDQIGFSGVIKNLLNLLHVLLSCFQDLIQNTPTLDAQSFDCMLLILQSIDIVVKFFVHGVNTSEKELQSPLRHCKIPNVAGGDHMISLLILKKLWDVFPLTSIHILSRKDDDRYFMLNAITTQIFLQLSDWICFPPAVLEKFLEFIEISLAEKICNGKQSVKGLHEVYVLPIISFIPRLIMRVPSNWRPRILLAFTTAFRNCNPESSMKLACLSVIKEMLDPEHSWLSVVAKNPEIQDYHINWIRELPSLLIVLGDKHPLSSKAALHLQLQLGQCAQLHSTLSLEYDNMQYTLKDFYSTSLDETSRCCGPFIRLPTEIQELSVCCLYYFSSLDPILLRSVVSCCSCNDLDPVVIFRILEVMHSAYKAGHIQIADYFSFLITLLSHVRSFPDELHSITTDGRKSNCGTFKSITSFVCSHLSQIGDKKLILQMLEKIIMDRIILRPSVQKVCAFLRVLVTLDSNLTGFSDESILNLTSVLAEYLIGVSSNEPEKDAAISHMKRSNYYFIPCFVLLNRNPKLLKLVLNTMVSLVEGCCSSKISHHHFISSMDVSTRMKAVVSILLHLNNDRKIHQGLVLCRTEMESIQQKMITLKSSEDIINKSIEERHKVQIACDRMRALMDLSFSGGIPVI